MPVFRQRTELDHPVEEVFAWHMRPGALERLTPPWESVRVRSRSGGIEDGGRVVLGLRRGPIKITWEVRHTAFERNRRFRDEQVSGPFAKWTHEHRFETLGPARSSVEDVVDWEPPLGSLGEALGGGFLRTTLDRLFHFRHRRLAHDLEIHRRAAAVDRLTVAVSGSTGFIGSQLVPLLSSGGHQVRRLTRSAEPSDPAAIPWNVHRGEIDRRRLEGVDAVVHLAGESISGVRWTRKKKKEILESRERGTLLLSRALAGLEDGPGVFVSASGVDYYGHRGDRAVTEETPSGEGFLPRVCRAWEGATEPARRAGIRVVNLRTGMVLSPAGGALGALLLPFRSGLGGRVGSGRQYMSWIDMDDHLGVIMHALTRGEVDGPMNSTSPYPVTNAAFADVLGRVLRRPTLIPLPAPAVRLLMGEMGESLLLEGARVLPKKARDTGYEFLLPGLEESLRFQLGRSARPRRRSGAGREPEEAFGPSSGDPFREPGDPEPGEDPFREPGDPEPEGDPFQEPGERGGDRDR